MSTLALGAGFARSLGGMLSGKLHRVTPSPGIVSFTFDGPSSLACRSGRRILEAAGVRATWYLSLRDVGADAGDRWLCDDDVSSLAGDGHEIACHTYSGIDCSIGDLADIEMDVERNATSAEHRFGESFVNFAYPGGRSCAAARRWLGRRFATCRGTAPGINRGWVDLAQLRANTLASATDPLPRAIDRIEDLARTGGWLLFRIRDIPETLEADGCASDDLRAVLEAVQRSGCRILPVRSALAAIAFRV